MSKTLPPSRGAVACFFFFFFFFFFFSLFHTCLASASRFGVQDARAASVLARREDGGGLTGVDNTTYTSDDSTLAEALELVKAAQLEQKQRNARLLANPRRNKIAFMSSGARTSLVDEDGTTAGRSGDGTGVNATVAAAAALVAEASAKNSTIELVGRGGSQLGKRSSYWMENMVQNGASPFAPSGYKVRFTPPSPPFFPFDIRRSLLTRCHLSA
jgi:hypothetical protein